MKYRFQDGPSSVKWSISTPILMYFLGYSPKSVSDQIQYEM